MRKPRQLALAGVDHSPDLLDRMNEKGLPVRGVDMARQGANAPRSLWLARPSAGAHSERAPFGDQAFLVTEMVTPTFAVDFCGSSFEPFVCCLRA